MSETNIREANGLRHWSPRLVTAASVVALALATVLATYLTVLAYGERPDWMEDLAVYVAVSRAGLEGQSLYDLIVPPPPGAEGSFHGGYAFGYPPFAALMFLPLKLVGLELLRVIWTFITVLVLEIVVFISLQWSGIRNRVVIAFLTAASTPLLIWFGPIYANLVTGQISLLLVALVLIDLQYFAKGRMAGVGIGLATGLKLTPAIFLVYLLLTRRYRAAIVAATTFFVTVLISFAVMPNDTVRFWSGVFLEADRVAIPQMRYNQSLHGVIVRLFHGQDVTFLWLVAVFVTAGAGLSLAIWAYRRGEDKLGILVTAGVGLLISPVSWEHHWAWLVPLIIYLGIRAIRDGTALWRVLIIALVAALLWRPYASLVPADSRQVLHITDPLILLFASWLPVLAVIGGIVLVVWLATRRTASVRV